MTKFLIVDDEKLIRAGILKFLSAAYVNDVQFYEAKNGQEALDICNTQHPDIMLTDIRMPVMDGVELIVEDEAVSAVADKALKLNTGARGLRGIFESIMTEIMYELPSRPDVEKCIITKDVVDGNSQPVLVLRGEEKKTERKSKSAAKQKIEKEA